MWLGRINSCDIDQKQQDTAYFMQMLKEFLLGKNNTFCWFVFASFLRELQDLALDLNRGSSRVITVSLT